MVQKKLPLINSAHGSDTRNIINELIKLFNDMGYTYDEALNKAHDILDEAQQTNNMNENVQQQINTLIAESGTSDSEVLQARIDAEGNAYPLLKDRLDESDAQLDRITTNLDNSLFGEFESDELKYPESPPDYPSIKPPFRVYRDLDGKIKHDFNFDSFEVGAGHVYVVGYGGNDSNDGLSPDTPVYSISKAMDIADTLPQETVVIHFMDNAYDESRFGPDYPSMTLSKNIVWKSDAPSGKTFMHYGTRLNSLTWEADGNSYKTNSDPVDNIFDTSIVENGMSKKYKRVSSVQAVKNGKGTWYQNGNNDIWIRRIDDSEPNYDIALPIYKPRAMQLQIDNHIFVTRDMQFYMHTSSSEGLLVRSNDISGEYWNENCVFGASARDGMAVRGVLKTYSFNSLALDVDADGFNYHTNTLKAENMHYAFEYNCKAYNCGRVGTANNNATTAHGGYTMLRIGSVGHDTYGPVLADVNECFSVNYDCVMYNSLRSAGGDKAAFVFSRAGGVKDGIAYLINCAGGGLDTYSITADVPVYIRDFKGKDIHPITEYYIY